MTKYLLSGSTDWGAEPPAADRRENAYQAVGRFNADLQEAGAWVFAGGLQPTGNSAVTRVEDGEVLTTDGPFAETKGQLGGIWIIEARDRRAALDWSAKASAACGNPVEVRPFQEVPEP